MHNKYSILSDNEDSDDNDDDSDGELQTGEHERRVKKMSNPNRRQRKQLKLRQLMTNNDDHYTTEDTTMDINIGHASNVINSGRRKVRFCIPTNDTTTCDRQPQTPWRQCSNCHKDDDTIRDAAVNDRCNEDGWQAIVCTHSHYNNRHVNTNVVQTSGSSRIGYNCTNGSTNNYTRQPYGSSHLNLEMHTAAFADSPQSATSLESRPNGLPRGLHPHDLRDQLVSSAGRLVALTPASISSPASRGRRVGGDAPTRSNPVGENCLCWRPLGSTT